jgi:flagellar assembly protein FliH
MMTKWSADDEAAEDYPLAFPPPPPRTPSQPVPAFPAPPPRPVTPATRAFPAPEEQQGLLRFGENILRDDRAGAVPTAAFDVDLRRPEALPADLVAQVRAHAEAAGYAAGWAKGRREAAKAGAAKAERGIKAAAEVRAAQAARVESAMLAITRAATGLERQMLPLAQDLEHTIVDTALQIASAVLGREIADAREPGREAIMRALALAPEGRPVTVRLNPVDRLTIKTTEVVMDGRTVTLVDDPTLQPGDAVAQCDATTIDARLEPAIERVREVLGL